MQMKSKPNTFLTEKPKKEVSHKEEVRFTDKERKQKEVKYHTVGGF